MSKVIRVKNGLRIRMRGAAEKVVTKVPMPAKIALKPTDFFQLTPKLTVKTDDKVKAGTPLFVDKNNPEIRFTAPLSGTVTEINRGERRKILEVVIAPDPETVYETFLKADPDTLDKQQIVANLLQSGLWPLIVQRPFGVIANPAQTPRAIFISGFDTAPLAPDIEFLLNGCDDAFVAGIKALAKLTDGPVHLGVNADFPLFSAFEAVQRIVRISRYKGRHPAGNVGVQINKISPINKGDIVWTIQPYDVVLIGRLFLKGILDSARVVALTGEKVKRPRYIRTWTGASIAGIVNENVEEGNNRYISGNALTGGKVSSKGYLGFRDTQITVIPEGNEHELFGWATPGFGKFSHSRTFWSWLTSEKEYSFNTNLHGGERAFVMSGQYEKVVPMDIYPVHLLKAILAQDIDAMEQLGIYEVLPEDFALCDFVCTSKIDAQDIVRTGLNLMLKEMS